MCIFCQIAQKQIPAKIIYENNQAAAFPDINPKSAVHFLIIPKKHIESISSPGSEEAVKELIKAVKEIAREQKLASYKLIFNVGKEAGQTIAHLHLHLLSGKVSALPV